MSETCVKVALENGIIELHSWFFFFQFVNIFDFFCKRLKLIFYTSFLWKWMSCAFLWAASLAFYYIFLVLIKTIFSKLCCYIITNKMITENSQLFVFFPVSPDKMVSNSFTVSCTEKACWQFFVLVLQYLACNPLVSNERS